MKTTLVLRAEAAPARNFLHLLLMIPEDSHLSAQNERRLHFGLGKNVQLEKVEIRWPSGKMQTLESAEVGKLNKVKEPA